MITINGATFKSLTSWETEYSFKELIKRFQDKLNDLGINFKQASWNETAFIIENVKEVVNFMKF